MPPDDTAGAVSRTHAERRAAALEVFERFTGGEVDPERAQRAMTRRLGALGTFAFDVVMGEVWSRPQLARRDRSLIVITVLAAIGAGEELSLHTEIGLNHGLTRSEIEEILLHIAAYAGFPMAMAASRVIDDRFRTVDGVERLAERSPGPELDDDERERRAAQVRQTLTEETAPSSPDQAQDPADHPAGDPAGDPAHTVEQLGDVGRIAYRWELGDLWARDELSRRDRSIVVIAILTVLSQVEALKFHIAAGLRHGLSRVEIAEIMVQMTIYGGIPRATAGHQAMQEAYDSLGRARQRRRG